MIGVLGWVFAGMYFVLVYVGADTEAKSSAFILANIWFAADIIVKKTGGGK